MTYSRLSVSESCFSVLFFSQNKCLSTAAQEQSGNPQSQADDAMSQTSVKHNITSMLTVTGRGEAQSQHTSILK